MQINSSLDWNSTSERLRSQMSRLGYNADLQKMFWNIDDMVTELSKLEVEARRIKKTTYLTAKIEEINNAIKHLEQLIMVGLLMK
jgi:archaellum component FlaC